MYPGASDVYAGGEGNERGYLDGWGGKGEAHELFVKGWVAKGSKESRIELCAIVQVFGWGVGFWKSTGHGRHFIFQDPPNNETVNVNHHQYPGTNISFF